ncbi:MAG: hypothetical protein LH649_02755 [Pseudanabaena sp. CAN_BIN31]|nr:hypothetical protein [Pseudanabaena sp. CAN_BIN31]
MTITTINLGDAFLLGTDPNGNHLFVAIAPTSNSRYVFVSLTTRRKNSETACVLLPTTAGAPSFIKVESVIAYVFAREMDTDELNRAVCAGSRTPYCQFPPIVLNKIQYGGVASTEIEPRFKRALKSFLGIS